MNLEARLGDAFEHVARYPVSPDLFARVQRSIDEDKAHRHRVILLAGSLVAGGVGLAGLVLAAISTDAKGQLVMARWSAELIETMIAVALIVGLGPLIRRFADAYVGQVFGVDAETGHRFLDLLDVAYYLVFAGVLLTSVRLRTLGSPVPVPLLAAEAAERFGLLTLIMGLLHATTVFGLPVLGLLGASARHRLRYSGALPIAAEARTAERLVRGLIYAVFAVVVLGVLFVALQVVVGLADI